MNVLQARDASGADVTATLVDHGAGWTLTIVHPTAGTATIELVKGMQSTGGAITMTPSTEGCGMQPLGTGVQSTMVTADGPVWGK